MQDESRHHDENEDVDLHAHWASLQAQHDTRKMRLMIIVGVIMVVVVVFWGFTVSDTVRNITQAAKPIANIRDSFAQGFNSYQKEMNSFGSGNANGVVATSTNEATQQFVETLKARAVDVTTSSSASQ